MKHASSPEPIFFTDELEWHVGIYEEATISLPFTLVGWRDDHQAFEYFSSISCVFQYERHGFVHLVGLSITYYGCV